MFQTAQSKRYKVRMNSIIRMERINKQINDTYRKAFFDLLEQKVREEPPDYDWITRLYAELKERLTSLLKPESALRKEMEELFDVELFDQMIRNKAFDGMDMYKLVTYSFTKCRQLGSPGRDAETTAKEQEVLAHMQSEGAIFATIVPLFLKNINESVDMIYEDMESLSKWVAESQAKQEGANQ